VLYLLSSSMYKRGLELSEGIYCCTNMPLCVVHGHIFIDNADILIFATHMQLLAHRNAQLTASKAMCA
jgi:hypothetical protein